MGNKGRVGYRSDVSDEEWAFVVPYLLLCREDAPQREYSLRAVFNGLRYLVRTGCQWRYLPHDLPPWPVVYQQTQRWIESHCFETMVEDLRLLLRKFSGRKAQPTAMLLDSRTIQLCKAFLARARSTVFPSSASTAVFISGQPPATSPARISTKLLIIFFKRFTQSGTSSTPSNLPFAALSHE